MYVRYSHWLLHLILGGAINVFTIKINKAFQEGKLESTDKKSDAEIDGTFFVAPCLFSFL